MATVTASALHRGRGAAIWLAVALAASTLGTATAHAATTAVGEVKGAECRRLLSHGALPSHYSVAGVAFTRPTGQAWGRSNRTSCRGVDVLMGREDLDGGKHTAVAIADFTAPVESAARAPTRVAALAATVEHVRTTQELRHGRPYETFESTPVTIDGTECARYERSGTDTQVPGQGSTPYTFQAHGMLCLYPGEPLSAVVQVEWSERFPKNRSSSRAVAREAAPWLAALHFGSPGSELAFDDFRGADVSFPDNTTSDWSARHTGRAYVLTLVTPQAPGSGTMKLEPARTSVAVQLTMQSTTTSGNEWHGPACLAPGRTGGYVFTVNNGTGEWRIADVDTANTLVVEHAVSTSSRIKGPGKANTVAIECTTDASGATTVSGVIRGKVVGRHLFSPGTGTFGSVGFLAQATKTKPAVRVTVDDLLVSVPADHPGRMPSTADSNVDRLRALLTTVSGTHYAAADLSPDDEGFYSREVFGDPHLDRWVVHDDGSLVGLLTLAVPPTAADDTEADLDSIVETAWSHKGETTETVTIAGNHVRRVGKPNLGATVHLWLDRGVYGQLVATDQAGAESFLASFIAAQVRNP